VGKAKLRLEHIELPHGSICVLCRTAVFDGLTGNWQGPVSSSGPPAKLWVS
jgi:hypothetical protein